MFFFTLLVIASIGALATNIYLPALPLIVTDLKSSQAAVQLTLSYFLLSYGSSQLFFGPLSEKIGRKKVIICGLLLMFIGAVCCFFALNINILVVGRFIEGLGAGALTALFRTVLRDAYRGDELARKGSLVSVGNAFCIAGAPTIGGYIQTYFGWRFNFLFIVIYTFITVALVHFWLQETLTKKNPHALKAKVIYQNYVKLIKSPVFLGYVGCGTFAFSGMTAYLAVAPFLFQTVMHLSPISFGWLAMFLAAGLALGGLINHLCIPLFGRHRILQYGTYAQTLAGLCMLLFSSLNWLSIPAIMGPMFLYMLGSGLIFSNASAGAFYFFAHIGGFTGALYGSCLVLGGTVSAAIMASFHAETALPLGTYLLIAGICGFFLQKMGKNFILKGDDTPHH